MSAINYKGIVNRFGLQQLVRPVAIPDFHLMVGSAEYLASMPVLVYQDYLEMIPTALQKPITDISYEQAQTGIENGELSPDDFVQNTFYIGSPLGEV